MMGRRKQHGATTPAQTMILPRHVPKDLRPMAAIAAFGLHRPYRRLKRRIWCQGQQALRSPSARRSARKLVGRTDAMDEAKFASAAPNSGVDRAACHKLTLDNQTISDLVNMEMFCYQAKQGCSDFSGIVQAV